MSNTIKIGKHIFTVQRSKYASVNNLTRYAGRTLTDCYTKPSPTKASIYIDWLKWASDNGVDYFGVNSYNTSIFTLQGLIEIDSTIYLLHITPSSNKAYIIE